MTLNVDNYYYLSKCGDYLGSGGNRRVYVHIDQPEWVIKVCKDRPVYQDQNIVEFNNWQDLKHIDDMARWLAPCIEISACGRYLVQCRGRPVPLSSIKIHDIPHWIQKLPDFNWLKHAQWVEIGGRLKICDYGSRCFSPTWFQ